MLGMLLTGCSKDDDNETPGLPPLPDPDDVCSCMDDLVFMQYCYDNFDINKDGKVSITEATAVTEINISHGVKSCKGIGYFPNLINLSICSSSITEIDLSNNTKLEYCDLNNNKLETVTLPRLLETCGMWYFPGTIKAFYGEYASKDHLCFIWNNILVRFIGFEMTTYLIPNNITEIGYSAFLGCNDIENITIPENVTKIGEMFLNAPNIYCKSTIPPIAVRKYGDWEPFGNTTKIYVPKASVNAYKTADGWHSYANQIFGYDF